MSKKVRIDEDKPPILPNGDPRMIIHIGYHKTGTSWLQNFLFNNSDFGFVSPFKREKEIGKYLIYSNSLDFSPKDCKDYFTPRILEAIRNGLIPVLSYERFSGNPHSGGYDSKEIANRLEQVFPNAKVLIVIREQKDMIYSTYKQYVIEGGPCSLKGYLEPPSRGRGRIPLFSFDHFKYHRLINLYIKLFGDSNVLVLPYELFREKPSEFFALIINFCGITTKPKMIDRLKLLPPINLGLSGFAISIKRRLNPLFARDCVNPWAIFPSVYIENQLEWWLKKWSPLFPPSFHRIFDKKLKKDILKMVGDRYKHSNRLTARILDDMRLERYGYDL